MATLTESQLQTLSSMRTQAQAGSIGYWQIYAWLANELDPGQTSVDSSVLWLRGATEANANRGAMATLIRAYTQSQYLLRYGSSLDDGLMQAASDAVAQNLIQDLLGENLDWQRGRVPDIGRIATADATAVGKVLFNSNLTDTAAALQANSAWSGSLLFSLLRSDQTWRLISTGSIGTIDTLNDIRDVLFSEASYAQALKAAQAMFKSESLSQQTTDLAIGSKTGISDWLIGADTFESLLAMIKKGAGTGALGEAFDRIYSAKPYRVMDMILGAKQGKAQIGTTTAGSFANAAKDFFGALSPQQMQSTASEILSQNVAGLVHKATTDVNARVALAALSFVSMQTNDSVVSKFQRYDSTTGQGDITDAWIRDRAKTLTAYGMYWRSGAEDNVLGTTLPFGLRLPFPQQGDTVISDASLGGAQTLTVDGIGGDVRYLRFGGDGAEVLNGGNKDDRLYGGAGSDTLDGLDGDDYIEGNADDDGIWGGFGNDTLLGGAGNDTLDGGKGNDKLDGGQGNDIYNFTGPFGNDRVTDSDGNGRVVVDGQEVKGEGSKKVGDGVYTDGTWVYTLAPTGNGNSDLILQRDGSLNSITLRGWQSGQLGISLSETPQNSQATNIFIGDYAKATSSGYYAFDAYYNYASYGPQPGADDVLQGTSGNDSLYGLAGNDGLQGYYGDDKLDGADGDDLLLGGYGADTLLGGAGKDFIFRRASTYLSPELSSYSLFSIAS